MDNESVVFGFIKDAEEPLSFEDIRKLSVQKHSNISEDSLNSILEKLISEEKIVSVEAYNRTYYIANNMGITNNDLTKLKTRSLEILVPAKAATDNAIDEIEKIRKEIKSIYANIISMMAVFIAIFSIVFAGANFLFKISKDAWSWQSLLAFFAAEAGMVLAILIMLWGIKKFLFK